MLVAAAVGANPASPNIYRLQTEDGRTLYTDRPATSTSATATTQLTTITLALPPAPTLTEQRQQQQQLRQEYEKVTQRLYQREREREQAWLAARQAQARFEQLNSQREAQREALAHERYVTWYGMRPLKPSYFQRQAQLDQQVQQAQQQAVRAQMQLRQAP
ncbi:hypothetical protein DU000_00455 [Parvibium lacunae]|uniref:DUF4124 domain-containing protein n=2 Tax=Parvibium lacunae TaxID=1888893 RepID=A0A368L6K4_9BURK|nr:hypothetical protein DU000_00455 [Parvibium lacunae]